MLVWPIIITIIPTINVEKVKTNSSPYLFIKKGAINGAGKENNNPIDI